MWKKLGRGQRSENGSTEGSGSSAGGEAPLQRVGPKSPSLRPWAAAVLREGAVVWGWGAPPSEVGEVEASQSPAPF